MTVSILALDRDAGAIGCAAATGNLAVGAWVLRCAAGIGAVATQGTSVSSIWGEEALARLQRGEDAEQVVREITACDTGREHRQLSVLDAAGGVAAWTGAENKQTRDHILGTDYVIAGNWLAGTEVLSAMEEAFLCSKQDLARSLLGALEAALAAGGDARGTLSAAIKLVSSDQPPLDLRVDYDDDPLAKLMALFDIADSSSYRDWTRSLPTLEDPYKF